MVMDIIDPKASVSCLSFKKYVLDKMTQEQDK
jgi:hypothetical protein